MEQSDKNNPANITDLVPEINCELVPSQNANQIPAKGQSFNPAPQQRSDKLVISISPEIRFANRDSIEDTEVDEFIETCEKQAILKEQKLARALRYALSIIASYEGNIEYNFASLPGGFCQGQVFHSARADILQIAGIRADSDLYPLTM